MEAIFALDDFVVHIEGVDADAIRFLSLFYDRLACPSSAPSACLGIDVLEGPRSQCRPDAIATRNSARVAVSLAADGRWALTPLEGTRGDSLEVIRCFPRQLWYQRLLQRAPALLLHASAVDDGEELVLFIGDKFSGKTSLMLDGVFRHRWTPVANDCVIAFASADCVAFTPWPTYARIRNDVSARYARFFDGPGIVHHAYGSPRTRHVTRTPEALYAPLGVLGTHPRMPRIASASRRISLVQSRFAAEGEPVAISTVDASQVGPLLVTSQKVVPVQVVAWDDLGGEPDRHRQEALSAAIARDARLAVFRHDGHVAPLLAALGS